MLRISDIQIQIIIQFGTKYLLRKNFFCNFPNTIQIKKCLLLKQLDKQRLTKGKFYPLRTLKGAYWISSYIAIAIFNFSLRSPFSYRSSNFAIAKLSLLIPLLHFLYKFYRFVHGFFSVLLPIQLSLFQLLRQQQLSLFYALKGVSEE